MSSKDRGKQSLRAWLRLLACENLIEQTLRARLRNDFSITLPQFDVLSELEHAGEQLTMSELSEKLMVSNGNVTGVVDRLERDNYVKRQSSPADRRVQHISLEEKGKAKFQEMAQVHEQWVQDLLSDLNLEDLDDLLKILNKTRSSVARNSAKEPKQ